MKLKALLDTTETEAVFFGKTITRGQSKKPPREET
jgi:hypothetical protein